ncbi:MAG: ceramidase domain-containing protein [Gammaproteobacteria bacterium]
MTIIVVSVIAVFSFGPFAQDPDYHRFADRRSVLGIANFYNVVSNLPFIIIGNMGMRLIMMNKAKEGLGTLRPLYFIFFAGVFLTGFGSAYYHYHPDNHTLFWDRLPMSIGFMAFFCVVVGECISARIALKLIIPLLVLGLASVVYWHATELGGRGDLRLYALVQFLPMILIPVILWLFAPTVIGGRSLWGMLSVYLVAKIAEFYDEGLYGFWGGISGHTLKHLLMAAGVLIVYRDLLDRKGGLSDRSIDPK